MRVLVCGADYHNRRALFGSLDRLHRLLGVSLMIHGFVGAARLAGEWAEERGVESRIWSSLPTNTKPDMIVEFSESSGNRIRTAGDRQAGVRTIRIRGAA